MSDQFQNDASMLEKALGWMQQALAAMDEDASVGMIAAHLDLAVSRLSEHLSATPSCQRSGGPSQGSVQTPTAEVALVRRVVTVQRASHVG